MCRSLKYRHRRSSAACLENPSRRSVRHAFVLVNVVRVVNVVTIFYCVFVDLVALLVGGVCWL